MQSNATNPKKLFRVSQINREIPNVLTCNPATYWRWATEGRTNVRTGKHYVLRTIKVGSALCTCREWVDEFFDALSERPGQPAQLAPRTQRHRLRDVERAERNLARRGM
jgi:hypothetical protein